MKVAYAILLFAALGCSTSENCCIDPGSGAIGGFGTGATNGTSTGTTSGAAPSATVVFAWAFENEVSEPLDCAEAGVQTIQVLIENNLITFPCGANPIAQTGSVAGVSLGDVPYVLTAIAADGVTILASTSDATVTVNPLEPSETSVLLTIQQPLSDVGLTWTFGGLSCVRAAVAQVGIQLTGAEDGGPAWTFPCEAFGDGGAGALLTGIPAGEQTFAVQGFGPNLATGDGGLVVAWTGSTQVLVGAATAQVAVDLDTRAIGAGSNVEVQWSFQGGDCLDAGEPTLVVALDQPDGGDAGFMLPCSNVLELYGLAPGTHDFTFATLPNDAGLAALATTGTFSVNGISTLTIATDLQPPSGQTTGTLSVGYWIAGAGLSCGDAGLTAIETKLFDSTGTPVPAGDVTAACSDLPVIFSALNAGVYTLNAQGLVGDTQAYALYGLDLTVAPGAISSYAVTLPSGL